MGTSANHIVNRWRNTRSFLDVPVKAAVESLERRILLTAVQWDGGGDGSSWSDPANWENNQLPAPDADIIIDLPDSDPTIRFTSAAGNQSVHNILSNESFELSGGELSVSGSLKVNAPFVINGGTLKGAVINQGSGAGGPFGTGRLGAGVDLGLGSRFVEIADPADRHFDIGRDGTLEAWINFNEVPTGGMEAILSKDEGPFFRNKWILSYAAGYGGVDHATMFHINGPGIGDIWLQSNQWFPNAGQWYHIAVVKTGHTYTFYRDGKPDGVAQTVVDLPMVISAPLDIGLAEGNFNLSAKVDDVRFWNVARSATQISQTYASNLSGTETGLQGYWRLDDAAGSTIVDSSRFGSAGHLYGGGIQPGIVTYSGGKLQDVTLSAPLVALNGANVNVAGTLTLSNGSLLADTGDLTITGSVAVTGNAPIFADPHQAVHIHGNLSGTTTDRNTIDTQTALSFDGSDSSTSPQLLEAMGSDLGAVVDGYAHNFAYESLVLGQTYVKLVDQSDNSGGSGKEAIYVNSLIVPAGGTLDLNGLQLYYHTAQIDGTVVGGSLTRIDAQGVIAIDVPTPAEIVAAGQHQDWSFFVRAGKTLKVTLDTAGGTVPSPRLSYALVELLDSSGNVLDSVASTTAAQSLALNPFTVPVDGTYRVRVSAPPQNSSATGNYMLSVWDITPDVNPLPLNQQANGEIETPFSIDKWTFSASAGQQIAFDLINRSNTSIVFDLSGPSTFSGFTNQSGNSDSITLPFNGTYTLTAKGTGGQMGSYAFRIRQVAATPLTLGQAYTGQFAGSGQSQLFQITVPRAGPLNIHFHDLLGNNVNELYVRFGAAPTRGVYDFSSQSPASSEQDVSLPLAYSGTWYVLLYCNTVRNAGGFSILASMTQVSIASITPNHSAANAPTEMIITGGGFVSGTQVSLVADNGTAYRATTVDINSTSELTATFAAGEVPADSTPYTVRVTSPGAAPATLTNAFTMKAVGQPHFLANLVLPSAVGYFAPATVWVDYSNTGDVAMPAPLLVVSAEQGTRQAAIIRLGGSLLPADFWTSALPEGFGDTAQFLASGATPGLLQPGESMRLPVQYVGWQLPWDLSYPPMNFTLGVVQADDNGAVDWAAIKDQTKPDYVQADAWGAIWNNFTAQAGGTWGSYVSMLDQNATYLAKLDAGTSDISRLFGFELRQAEGLSPIRYLDSSTDDSMPAPGMDLTFSRQYAQPISRRYRLGPLGRGWVDEWQWTLVQQSDGTILISDPTGTPRIFQPDRRTAGAYFSAPGDSAVLQPANGGGFVLREVDGLVRAFRADGNLDYIEDTNGNRIQCSYTGSLLTRLTHSDGDRMDIAYNASGRIATLTDSNGRQTLFTYDAQNEHLRSVKASDGRITSYTYTSGQGAASEHALSQISYPGGTHQTFTYDQQGRMASAFADGGAEKVDFAYDSAGMVTATDALGNPSKFYFGDWGQILRTTNALGNSVSLALDDKRNITSITDAAGRSDHMNYDDRGNVTGFTDAMGHLTSFTYTTDLNLLASMTDANGNPTHYAYDDKGNLKSITYADGSVEGWDYDPQGDPSQWTNRRGDPIGYVYNAQGQVTRKNYADGTHVEYAYDARGNLTQTVDSTGTAVYTYDVNEFLTRIDYPGGQWLTFAYDDAGRRATSLDQLGHQLTYHYDSVGRLSFMTDETSAQIVHYTYDVMGQIARKDLGNGVYTTYAYDAAGQLLHLVNLSPDGTVLSHFDYAYDSRGRRLTQGTNYGLWTYEYDDLGELTHAVLISTDPDVPNQDLAYVYDAMGNRAKTIENGVTTLYTTNNMNQYTKVGDTSYTFDEDGNLIEEATSAGTTTYSYDDDNRLIAVTRDADQWSYTYNAFGQKAISSKNGSELFYVIDFAGLGNLVGEYDSTGAQLERYDYGFDLLARTTDEGSQYFTFDAIGNNIALTSRFGDVLDAHAYGPFGTALRDIENARSPFEFVGEWGVIDESNGLISMRNRYYSPGMGRFIQSDPIGISIFELNPNRYARNNPIAFIDPAGLATKVIIHPENSPFLPDNPYPKKNPNEVPAPKGTPPWSDPPKGTPPYTDPPNGTPPWSDPPWKKDNPDIGWKDTSSTDSTSIDWDDPSLTDPPVPLTDPVTKVPIHTQGAVDPNEKSGPAGFGNDRFITGERILPYRIDFENDPNATAPAQQVTISDPISDKLDWSTFELTEISFGDNALLIPSGLQHYQAVVPMTFNGLQFNVNVEAGIDPYTGVVFADFTSLDLNTLLPLDVSVGFLPPEDGTGRGQGHVSYLIKARNGLSTGTQIRNIADIVFDHQPAIRTNQVDPHDPAKGNDPAKECLNTIDSGAPTSSVSVLPPQSAGNFAVVWLGQDDAGGSGIAFYDVYVSDNGAPASLWRSKTSDTQGIYAGKQGHTYHFYSIAYDNVGHIEAPPVAADASTTVDDATPPKVLTAQFDGSTPVVTQGHFVTVQFSESVQSSLSLADIKVRNLTTASDLIPTSLTYNASSNTMILGLGTSMADGNYSVTLSAAGITDQAGNSLDGDTDGLAGGDYILGFFTLLGDVNHDRVVNQADRDTVIGALGTSGVRPQDGDANGDHNVDFADLVAVAQHYGKTGMTLAQGDFTGDNLVDFADLVIVAQHYGKGGVGDLNGDNIINQLDLDILNANFGHALPVPGAPIAAPEVEAAARISTADSALSSAPSKSRPSKPNLKPSQKPSAVPPRRAELPANSGSIVARLGDLKTPKSSNQAPRTQPFSINPIRADHESKQLRKNAP